MLSPLLLLIWKNIILVCFPKILVPHILSKCLGVKVELMPVSWSPWKQYNFFFSKARKKLLFSPAELLAGIRSSVKTWLLIPSQAIFQPDNIILWSLTFDIPSSIVRELEHSSFPRNWGTNKSSGGNHHVPRFDWENRGTNFESSVLLHCSGFRQVFL